MKLKDYVNKNNFDSIGKSFLKSGINYAYEGDVVLSYTFLRLGLDNLTCDCLNGGWFISQKLTKEAQIKANINVNTKEYNFCYSFLYFLSEHVEGYLDKSLILIDKYLKISPDYLGFYLKGRILSMKDQKFEALVMYEKSHELDKSSRNLYRIGRQKEFLNINGMKEIFQAAIENPHSVCCYRILKVNIQKRGIKIPNNHHQTNPLVTSFLDTTIDEWDFQKEFVKILNYDFSNFYEVEKKRKILDNFSFFLRMNEFFILQVFLQKNEIKQDSLFDDTKAIMQNENSYVFSIENQNAGQYKYYALWQYFPVNRFPANTLKSKDLVNRNLIFEFKDGINPEKFAKIIAIALKNKFNPNILSNKTLIIIPASNSIKTEKRFKTFCQKLSAITGLENGYEFLVNNEENRTPVHKGGDRNKSIISSIRLNTSVNGKSLIVIDDVRTSGKSSNDIHQYLKQNGAKTIVFIYVGKTVSSNFMFTSAHNNEIDDLPF